MYLINQKENDIEKLEKTTFKSAGMKERSNLQEWIAKNPQTLGEELLIIQKEYSGFGDTNERLDLLALDKKGNLVIIENKLDDTGKDVVWQAIKYASYCSTLNSDNIRQIFQEYLTKISSKVDVKQSLENFFGDEDYEEKLNIGNTQRIILVAGEFRKEVTSTVMWLLNYGIRAQCFKVAPYKMGENFLLDINQIIPIKEAEDYIIKIASKNREEIENQDELENRYIIRQNFWSQFLREINKQNNLCANLNPTKESWIGVSLGMSGVSANLVISRSYARTEIYINRGNASENKKIFDYFLEHKDQIEKDFGAPLIWERMDDKVTSRIKWQLDNVSVFEEKDYTAMNEFMIDGVVRIKKAFSEFIKKL